MEEVGKGPGERLSGSLAPNRSGRRCRCTWHSWKQTGGTTQCHLRRNRHNPPRTCSNRCSAWGSALELVAVVAEMGLSRIHRSSEHSSPTSNQGLSDILRSRPKLRNSDSHRSMASAEELAAEDFASLLLSLSSSLLGRYRNLKDNRPACKRGLPDILRWRPIVRTDYYHLSTLATAEVLSRAPSCAMVGAPSGAVAPCGAVAWTGTQASAYSANRSRTRCGSARRTTA